MYDDNENGKLLLFREIQFNRSDFMHTIRNGFL